MINNKGLGAGGKNTNESGIPFENKTKSCIKYIKTLES